MIPRILIDTAEIPNGGGELRLFRRELKNGPEFSIMLGSNELMNSRLSGSEEALASLTCERIASRPNPCVLIGGLGMGFTLRAALHELPTDANVTVAELVPAVIRWAKGEMDVLCGDCLSDNRTKLVQTDVRTLIDSETNCYDAILLDVDNGPDGLTQDGNNWLYSRAGLISARNALRAGGTLAVWSTADDIRFTRRMEKAGFTVEQTRVRAHRGRGAHHIIWLGRP